MKTFEKHYSSLKILKHEGLCVCFIDQRMRHLRISEFLTVDIGSSRRASCSTPSMVNTDFTLWQIQNIAFTLPKISARLWARRERSEQCGRDDTKRHLAPQLVAWVSCVLPEIISIQPNYWSQTRVGGGSSNFSKSNCVESNTEFKEISCVKKHKPKKPTY